MKISFVSPLLSRHLNPMGARTQTAIARKGGATIGILDVEITRDSSKLGMPPEAAAICRMTEIRCSANYFEN